MSKGANYTVIGAFIVSAVALALGATVIFGSGKFFTESVKYITCFTGSVNGLRIGAPVNFRGARVGTVREIRLVFETDRKEIYIPVVIEILKGSVIRTGEAAGNVGYVSDAEHEEIVKRLIEEQGLRAQLAMESFVTGQLYVDLDFRPQNAPHYAKLESSFVEIPTIPSPFEKITHAVENIKFDEIAAHLQGSLAAIEELAGSEELRGSLKSLKQFLDEGAKVFASVHAQLPELGAEGKTLAEETRDALDQARQTFQTYEALAARGSPLERELIETLRDVQSAANSLQSFAEYVERNPETLLRGKHP